MLVVDTQSKIAQVYLTSFIFRNILFVTHFVFERCGYGGAFLISRILWLSLRRFFAIDHKKWQALTRKGKIKKTSSSINSANVLLLQREKGAI